MYAMMLGFYVFFQHGLLFDTAVLADKFTKACFGNSKGW